MQYKKSEIIDKIIFTVKIAAGSCISILLAEYMRLNFVSSAGIITLLSILTTKWATVKLAVNRVLSFVVTVCISKIAFWNSGSNWMNYFLFLLLLVGISLALKWRDTISVNAVIGTHFMETHNFGYTAILNELLLVILGISVALLLNFIQNNRDKEKQLKNDMRYIEQIIQQSLDKIAGYLRHQKSEGNVWDDIISLEQYLSDALDRACRYQNNTFVSHPEYYINYIEMRNKQTNILHNLHYEIKKIREIPEQAKKIADYIEYLSVYVLEKNIPEKQLFALEEMKKKFRQDRLPQTREEFEGRAVLYHIMMDLEEFLMFKKRFIEGMDEEQKKIYWEQK